MAAMQADANIDGKVTALDPKAERRRQKEEAKQAKKDAKGKNKGKGGVGRKILITMVIVALLLGGVFVAILVLNPLNLRDGALAPMLVNIPIVRDFVNQQEYEYVYIDGELVAVPVEVPEVSPGELAAEVERLGMESENLLAEIYRLTELNRIYVDRISDLDRQMRDQAVFEADRAAFEIEAANASPELFRSWFENFDPERAANIFGRIAAEDALNQEYRAYFNRIMSMEESAVADALEDMIPVHTNMVVAIMRGLGTSFAGEVLSAMESQNAALIMRQMYPMLDMDLFGVADWADTIFSAPEIEAIMESAIEAMETAIDEVIEDAFGQIQAAVGEAVGESIGVAEPVAEPVADEDTETDIVEDTVADEDE
ncbi:MAG: hypothetical protein FWD96_00705 [Defluviitaleaceae bacterium]|nr:hypothetical protein [Defluviitaleaceae bacterium]